MFVPELHGPYKNSGMIKDTLSFCLVHRNHTDRHRLACVRLVWFILLSPGLLFQAELKHTYEV